MTETQHKLYALRAWCKEEHRTPLPIDLLPTEDDLEELVHLDRSAKAYFCELWTLVGALSHEVARLQQQVEGKR